MADEQQTQSTLTKIAQPELLQKGQKLKPTGGTSLKKQEQALIKGNDFDRLQKNKQFNKVFNRNQKLFTKQADGSYMANRAKLNDKDVNKIRKAAVRSYFIDAMNKASLQAAKENFGITTTYKPSIQLINQKEKTPEEINEWNQIRDELVKLKYDQTKIPTDIEEARKLLDKMKQQQELSKQNTEEVQSNTNPKYLASLKPDPNYSLFNNESYKFISDLSFQNPNIQQQLLFQTTSTQLPTQVKKGAKINYLTYY